MRVLLLILFSCSVAAIHAFPSIDRVTEEGLQNVGLLREFELMRTGELKPPVKPETKTCDKMGGQCMSEKDKKKCAGDIVDMGKCKVNEEVCCVADGIKPTGEPVKPVKPVIPVIPVKPVKPVKPVIPVQPDIKKCKKMGGQCLSKEDIKKCAGDIVDMGKCKGKTEVCCVADGIKPTGEQVKPVKPVKPATKKCEKMGGQCMSKKDKKKCAGDINDMGKCKGKKDVCCVSKESDKGRNVATEESDNTHTESYLVQVLPEWLTEWLTVEVKNV